MTDALERRLPRVEPRRSSPTATGVDPAWEQTDGHLDRLTGITFRCDTETLLRLRDALAAWDSGA
jgi:hypothetical protein